MPAGLILVSPLVSGNTSTWLWQYTEDLVTPLLAKQVLKEYLGLPSANTDDLHLLKLCHITSDFDRFLPKNLLVYVGEREVMREDIMMLANAVKQDSKFNVEVRKENYEHDWYFIREVVKLDERHLLAQSDEQFAAFAAKALREAREAVLSDIEKLAASTSNSNEFIQTDHHHNRYPLPDRLILDIDNAELESEAMTVSAILA
jgi:acetyl esterase/lipase